jgi:hypothetical protein
MEGDEEKGEVGFVSRVAEAAATEIRGKRWKGERYESTKKTQELTYVPLR